MGKEKKKEYDYSVSKWFLSLQKEKLWLEEMALDGYKLVDIRFGIHFQFKKIEPTRLVYDIDRFCKEDNTMFDDYAYKDRFIEMAEDMGWEVVTHDEDMNYYFCKEYQPQDCNSLYDDETRVNRAKKYQKRYLELGAVLSSFTLIINVLILSLQLIIHLLDEEIQVGFLVFLLLYNIFCLCYSAFCKKAANYYYEELSLSTEQWVKMHAYRKEDTKRIRHLFLRGKKLMRFLEEESANGWHVTRIGLLTYYFEKGEPKQFIYTTDSKHLINKRKKRNGQTSYGDKKDMLAANSDWQIGSTKEAKEKGWNLVCTYKNILLVYRKEKDNKDGLMLQQGNQQSLVGLFLNRDLVFLSVCIGSGFIFGFVAGMLELFH